MSGSVLPVAFTVDGTAPTCRGAIAKLEPTMRTLPPGSLVRVIVGNVPNVIDISAWAERKGHRVTIETRHAQRFELLIEKDGGRKGSQASPVPPEAAVRDSPGSL